MGSSTDDARWKAYVPQINDKEIMASISSASHSGSLPYPFSIWGERGNAHKDEFDSKRAAAANGYLDSVKLSHHEMMENVQRKVLTAIVAGDRSTSIFGRFQNWAEKVDGTAITFTGRELNQIFAAIVPNENRSLENSTTYRMQIHAAQELLRRLEYIDRYKRWGRGD